VDVRGTHTNGVDTRNATLSGAAVRLGNGQYIRARDGGDTTDLAVLVQSSGNLIVGDAATTAIYSRNVLAPFTDNTVTCGANGNRWSAVWAANGTIQTSDPSLKKDIQPLDAAQVARVFGLIHPIRFKWVDGGDGKPGVRQHWGWNAEEVRDAFEAVGEDFGGYVKGEDGHHYLRPDQLLPVLWEYVRTLEARVAALEAVR
jgi:hypothetical protein